MHFSIKNSIKSKTNKNIVSAQSWNLYIAHDNHVMPAIFNLNSSLVESL